MVETFLAADIGGTSARIAIVKGRKVVFQERPETKAITNIAAAIAAFLAEAKKRGHRPKAAAVAVAGPIEEKNNTRVATMTNAAFTIDQRDLERQLKLPVLLINDFEAAAYAATVLKGRSIRKGVPAPGKTIAVVGAGTGLGKALLIYDQANNTYTAVASEGGHADLPLTKDEQSLAGILSPDANPTYEDALSGRGLERLYHYLRLTRFRETQLPMKLTAAEIGSSRDLNQCSAAAFALFIKLYARCCRNFVLDAAAWNGVVLAGGIAAKNQDAFDTKFLAELSRHPSKQYAAILANVPVRIITTPDAGLLGAAAAFDNLRKRGKEIKRKE